ncbi:hypothetical protein HGRIS_014458 [Hohenbuehelia grisea]|uniref:Uncharacterized protein n=1 Tax=Hohenbuehelia grisea TaxID=104357 RepID=A0ABR3JVR6_9AGAR
MDPQLFTMQGRTLADSEGMDAKETEPRTQKPITISSTKNVFTIQRAQRIYYRIFVTGYFNMITILGLLCHSRQCLSTSWSPNLDRQVCSACYPGDALSPVFIIFSATLTGGAYVQTMADGHLHDFRRRLCMVLCSTTLGSVVLVANYLTSQSRFSQVGKAEVMVLGIMVISAAQVTMISKVYRQLAVHFDTNEVSID